MAREFCVRSAIRFAGTPRNALQFILDFAICGLYIGTENIGQMRRTMPPRQNLKRI